MKTTKKYWNEVFDLLKGEIILEHPIIDVIDDHASNWPDCACGVQDSRIPRNKMNQPLDDQLRFLGEQFASILQELYPLSNDKFHKYNMPYWECTEDEQLMLQQLTGYAMEDIMHQIDLRSTVLLKEMEVKL